MNNTNTPRLKVPLGSVAHQKATSFAVQQITPQKGKRTYLNTLAVYAVHSYLKWLQIETDLSSGDSWNLARGCLFDVADLVIPNIGKLECRPVLPGQTTISLPIEATIDRIGYIAVQFDEDLNEVQLVGFIQAEDIGEREEIPITDFQSIDTLLDYLRNRIVQSQAPPLPTSITVNLSQWFSNIFENDWQSASTLFATASQSSGVRNTNPLLAEMFSSPLSVSGGKLIDLGIQINQHPLALVVTVTPTADDQRRVLVQVYPMRNRGILPQGVELEVFNEDRTEAMDTISRASDNWIQIDFFASVGERFFTTVTFTGASLTQGFLV